MYKLHQGDVLRWLSRYRALVQAGRKPRFHAVFADPPYYLDSIQKRFGKPGSAPAQFGKDGVFSRASRGFMGQQWDGFESIWHYQAWVTEWARFMLDIVYPGAVLLMYGSPRTYHRLACGLEDAGWEIFDSLMFLHGQGFPKSHDISKGIDKAAGAEREVTGYQKATGTARAKGAAGNYANSMVNFAGDAYEIAKDGWNITAPATDAARQWQGYGTALKPAFEPLVLARAPRGNLTYAQLAQQFGTGALNVDGSRIALDGTEDLNTVQNGRIYGDGNVYGTAVQHHVTPTYKANGRWPSNLLLAHTDACTDAACAPDCPVRLLGEQSGESMSPATYKRTVDSRNRDIYSKGIGEPAGAQSLNFGDTGTAARFFYTAKAASWEREAGLDGRCTHPTVKSIQLNEYMARLILPPPLDEPRRILIPFAGVASEMIGAHLAGWDEITGIEKTPEYIPQGRARLAWWQRYSSYEKAQAEYKSQKEGEQKDAEREQAGQLPLF